MTYGRKMITLSKSTTTAGSFIVTAVSTATWFKMHNYSVIKTRANSNGKSTLASLFCQRL
jgi:hypothetical protein